MFFFFFFSLCQFNYKTGLSFCTASYNYDFILVFSFFFRKKKKSFKNVYKKKKFFIRIYFGNTECEQKKKVYNFNRT